jgi:hypothetical protein
MPHRAPHIQPNSNRTDLEAQATLLAGLKSDTTEALERPRR